MVGLSPEPSTQITLQKEWAKYTRTLKMGKKNLMLVFHDML